MRVERLAPRASGFSLIETLIGLTLLAAILLATASMVAVVPREIHRVAARREATRALEATLESMRAGQLPAASGVVEPNLYRWTQPQPPTAKGLRLWINTEPIAPPGLFRVTVRARYSVHHQVVEQAVETLTWRP